MQLQHLQSRENDGKSNVRLVSTSNCKSPQQKVSVIISTSAVSMDLSSLSIESEIQKPVGEIQFCINCTWKDKTRKKVPVGIHLGFGCGGYHLVPWRRLGQTWFYGVKTILVTVPGTIQCQYLNDTPGYQISMATKGSCASMHVGRTTSQYHSHVQFLDFQYRYSRRFSQEPWYDLVHDWFPW